MTRLPKRQCVDSSPGDQRAHVRVCSTMFNTGSCSAWLETEAQQSMRQSGSRTVPVALLLNPPCRTTKQVTRERKFESAVLCSISEQPMGQPVAAHCLWNSYFSTVHCSELRQSNPCDSRDARTRTHSARVTRERILAAAAACPELLVRPTSTMKPE